MMNEAKQDNGGPKPGQVVCPRSEEFGTIHWGSVRSIRRWGICARCRSKIKGSGAATLQGKIESPVEMTYHSDLPSVDQDHAAYTAPGQLVPVVDFPFAQIDEALGFVKQADADTKTLAAELFGRVMMWVWKKPNTLKIATARFSVLTAALRPDLLDNRTWEQIGDELRLTKQAICKHARVAQKAFNIKFQRTRRQASCALMRAARLGGPNRHHHKARHGNV